MDQGGNSNWFSFNLGNSKRCEGHKNFRLGNQEYILFLYLRIYGAIENIHKSENVLKDIDSERISILEMKWGTQKRTDPS